MSSNRHQIVRRKVGSVVFGLLGLFFLVSAAGPHVDGLRTRHIEYMQNIPIFVVISVVCMAIGSALLFAAWRLWRVPKQLP